MNETLSPTTARRVFLILTLTRWLPTGMVTGQLTLLPLERGLSVSQTLFAMSIAGFVVFSLELPTSGFADAFGRRPVYLTAAAVNIAVTGVFIFAETFWAFALAGVLNGIFRALDSGPLDAWFVDTVHATEPGADVDRTLAAQGAVLGAAMAGGALVSGGLVLWHPIASHSALLLPFLVCLGLNLTHLTAVLMLLREQRTHVDRSGMRRAADSVREAPDVVRDGLSTLRHNRVLRGIVLVELFWTVAMVVFESFQPIRLAELLGSEVRAGAWMGPITSVGWGVFALGSALAGLATARIGVARAAILARILNGLGVVWMGLAAGPVGLVVAYLFSYGMHGSGGPAHSSLLHREARARNRATVLSMNSMVAFAGLTLAAPTLGVLADSTSNQLAMASAGAFSLIGALCYLPALRAERDRAAVGSARFTA